MQHFATRGVWHNNTPQVPRKIQCASKADRSAAAGAVAFYPRGEIVYGELPHTGHNGTHETQPLELGLQAGVVEPELVQGVAKNGCRKTKVGCGVVVVASSIGLAHSLYNTSPYLSLYGQTIWDDHKN